MNRIPVLGIIAILLVPPLADRASAQSDARAFSEIFGDEFIAENARFICRRAAELNPSDRFEFLCRWVLPGPGHPDFRVEGVFTQTDPSPLALKRDPAIHRSTLGAALVSPVFDLLDAAHESGRLEELKDRISQTAESDEQFQRRARAALRLLVHLELGETPQAEAAVDDLRELATQSVSETLHEQWPETLVVYRGLHRFPDNSPIGDLLTLLYSQRTMIRPSPAIDDWRTQIVSLLGLSQHPGDGRALEQFVPVVSARASTRGAGAAHARWEVSHDNTVHHVAGHQVDYLFYRAPLRGNFAVECDLGCFGDTQALAAGRFLGTRYQLDQIDTGTFRGDAQVQPFAPRFGKMRDWVRFRAVYDDGTLTVFLNGRMVHEELLPEHYDPWLGIRSWWRNTARFRDFRISGQPEIPDSVVMSASPTLAGWMPYFDESAGHAGAAWQWSDDPQAAGSVRDGLADASASTGQIVGARDHRLAGSFCESLLRYQTPIDKNGAVEYEFFYEPGEVLVHPALDRLAFILDPDGVRVHWTTDAVHDRTDVPPDNLIDEPHSRRGPAAVPLNSGAWNHLTLSLQGAVAQIQLNGQLVFERNIESSNRRTFGLFHFSDQTEVRVRNVVMRGDWGAVPSAAAQELADARVVELDATRGGLPSVFSHDFREGLPAERFRFGGNGAESHFSTTADGVLGAETSPGSWSSVVFMSRFSMQGDFDVEASFDQLDTGPDEGESTILLIVRIDGDGDHQVRAGRMRHEGAQNARGQLVLQYPDGVHRYIDIYLPDESTSGHLRLARRGDTVAMLFAQEDSPQFRIIAEHEGIHGPVPMDGIQLSIITNERGRCSVVWKDLTLRAEQLQYMPDESEAKARTLFLMKADGTGLRELTAPPGRLTHLGSPEWSADGRLITLDVSTGTTTTSHVFVVDVNTGEATDLGPGCMPSFSKDDSRIVFSQPGQGIVIMDADGANRHVIDRSGWGVQFSPDGKFIAYAKSDNITLRNITTGDESQLLRGEHANRYGSIYWNLGWSHDSRSIAFKARNRQTGESELAVADINSPDGFQVLYATTGSLYEDFTWSPENEHVLFSMHSPEHQSPRLFFCSRNEPGPPTLLPGQPADIRIFDCAWSSEDIIAFAGQRIPQPVNWPPDGGPEQQSE